MMFGRSPDGGGGVTVLVGDGTEGDVGDGSGEPVPVGDGRPAVVECAVGDVGALVGGTVGLVIVDEAVSTTVELVPGLVQPARSPLTPIVMEHTASVRRRRRVI